MYELKGKVVAIGKPQTFSSGFTKREVIIDTATDKSKYPNPIKVEFVKDRCSALDNVAVGQAVTVKFAVNGRKWDGPRGVQYFVDIAGMDIAVEGKENRRVPEPAVPPLGGDASADDDGMPF